MDKKITASGIVLLFIISSISFGYYVNIDKTTLKRDGVVMFRERWYVEAERTYINLDSWYDTNVKCPRIEALGGYRTAKQCRYPEDYYESTSRSLINTLLIDQEISIGHLITKEVPHYAYGTSGSYAGKLTEYSYFEEETLKETNIPHAYWTEWDPKDTRNYKLKWHITEVKDIDVPNGNYTACNYYFGDVIIDINDCDKMERVEITNEIIDIYFKPERDFQNISVKIYDPIIVETTKIDKDKILDSFYITHDGYRVCMNVVLYNPTDGSTFYDGIKIDPGTKELITTCYEREFVLDSYTIDEKMDVLGIENAVEISETVNEFKFYTNDEELIVG